MTTPFPFVSGQVLTAAQLNDIQNLPISDKTASYTLLVGDVTKRTIMNSASATTITVDDSIFTESDVIQVANKGAGTCTITAGVTFTSDDTLTVSTAGLFDVALISGAGGAGGGYSGYDPAGGGGGGAGGVLISTIYLTANASVTVGAGGAGGANIILVLQV
jgi:hypothetical protein